MGSFYDNLCRMYFIFRKSVAEGVFRRWSGTGGEFGRLKRLVQRYFLQKAHAWADACGAIVQSKSPLG